jgi:hypothetical protein
LQKFLFAENWRKKQICNLLSGFNRSRAH